MGLFSSTEENKETCDESSKSMKHHDGPILVGGTDEQWYGKFEPVKQDENYIYGYVEKEDYAECESCGSLVRHRGAAYPDKEFKKMPKEDVPEAKIEELEITLEKLKYK